MELQEVLPNARRFAFTGTPIPKTHQEFGAKDAAGRPEYYLDRYSIKDAIDDGATKEIRYTFGPVEYQLDKEKLKQGWNDIAAELTEEEKEAVQRRVRPWRTFLKNPDRVAILAADIAKDYREVLEPLGFKAQLVACDKEACVAYYDALLEHFDASEICIVFSQGHYDDEARYALYSPHYLSDVERKRVIRNFRRRLTDAERARGNNLKILIVCNMLLTGFDAPIEQTMYLDSPLRDHNLLQAVARTNRPYDDKETKVAKAFGRIVDYVGVFQNYLEALAYDPADIGDFPDIDSLANTFPQVVEAAMVPFAAIALEDSYECSIAIVRVLSTLDQAEFEGRFRDVLQLWEAISPHPMLLDHRDRYRWLCEIYEIYLEEFKRLDFDAEIHAAKTRKLIHESTRLIKFRGHLPEVAIDSRYLDNLESTKLTPDDKAEKIIRDIETVIRLHESENPVYVEFQERLERLINEKAAHAKSIEKLIDDLSGLYRELDEVASLPERMGFAERGEFDVYIELKHSLAERFDDKSARGFATRIARLVKRKVYAGWQDNDQELKRLRTEIGLLADDEDFEKFEIADDEELVEAVLRRLVQHYRLG
jgi:type I restriction enzyme R subunit